MYNKCDILGNNYNLIIRLQQPSLNCQVATTTVCSNNMSIVDSSLGSQRIMMYHNKISQDFEATRLNAKILYEFEIWQAWWDVCNFHGVRKTLNPYHSFLRCKCKLQIFYQYILNVDRSQNVFTLDLAISCYMRGNRYPINVAILLLIEQFLYRPPQH